MQLCRPCLLTVNCGPVVKGSGNGFITGSAGNVFIFKKKREIRGYTFRPENIFEVFTGTALVLRGRILGRLGGFISAVEGRLVCA